MLNNIFNEMILFNAWDSCAVADVSIFDHLNIACWYTIWYFVF